MSVVRLREFIAESSLPQDEGFLQAIANTPGAVITATGVRIPVIRFQLPEQSGELSVRSGVFYLPDTKTASRYYYSTGKNGYGGKAKVAKIILLRHPIVVKASTGGKGPERSFDQVQGKGAYKAMREEVISSVLSYGRRGDIADNIQKIFNKYRVKLDPYYVLRVSEKGNLLAYAVQEVIVAYTLRKAGYDSMVCWNLLRGIPVLTEIFVLRERYYPEI